MHMPSGYLPDTLLLICSILSALIALAALFKAERHIWSDWSAGLQIGFLFIVLIGLYSMQANIRPGMAVHWLGVMLTVMMVGPWTAILVLSSVHIVLLLGPGVGAPDTLGFNIFVTVMIPVGVAALVHSLTYRYLPRNLMVYIAKTGFGDLFCMLSVDLVLTVTLWTYFSYPDFIVRQDFILLLALMGGMEALISTWIISILVCYVPSWLVTFNDEEYLGIPEE
ncbi:MAG: energy-coupling factor ABC transporter permease [Mariprofundaceae bacterium]|nr:energy-coupling factor ABC transporter permease [Mariprofundaceae bacterium]